MYFWINEWIWTRKPCYVIDPLSALTVDTLSQGMLGNSMRWTTVIFIFSLKIIVSLKNSVLYYLGSKLQTFLWINTAVKVFLIQWLREWWQFWHHSHFWPTIRNTILDFFSFAFGGNWNTNIIFAIIPRSPLKKFIQLFIWRLPLLKTLEMWKESVQQKITSASFRTELCTILINNTGNAIRFFRP